MVLSNGTMISERYEIIQVLGKGGMAIAYKARDTKLDRDVTVKVLRDDFIDDEDFIEKFRTEARSAASLSHPNIVSVYDVGNDGKIYYIVMEYVHGDDLKRTIEASAPFDSITVISIAIQIASALSNAHKHNIVHRDIKPQNILISLDGTTKVTDFGVARAISGATMATAANAVGSVHYFSPEQARGGYVDEKSDIYSLGITMFEMVTGTLPYDGDSSVAVALKHLKEQLPDMREFNPDISPLVEGIIKKATKKNPDERYENVDLLLADLRKALKEISQKVKTTSKVSGAIPVPNDEIDIPEFKSRQEAISSLKIEDVPQKEIKYSKRQLKEIEKNNKMKISKDDDYEQEYVPSKRRQAEYEDGYDKDKEKKVIIVAILTSLIIIALITLAGLKFLRGDSPVGGVSVPTFTGITLEQAEEIADGLGIKVVKIDEQTSEKYDEGLIIDQNIKEGQKVSKGEEIGVIVSGGVPSADMPDVLGKSEDDATDIIKRISQASIKFEYEVRDGVEHGIVLNQEPKSGTKINDDTIIVLTISEPEDVIKIKVPNLVGKTEEQAKKEIEKAGLKIGNITEVDSDKVEKGLVVTQTIYAGDEVTENTALGFSISKGNPKESTDNNTPPADNEQNNNNNNGNNNNGNNNNANTPKTVTVTIQPTNLPQTSDVFRVELIKVGSTGQMETVVNEVKTANDFPYYVNVTGTGKMELQLYIDGALQWSKNVNFSEGGN